MPTCINQIVLNVNPHALSLTHRSLAVCAAITRRKIVLVDDNMVRAINNFDLKLLPTERVEILQRILPNEKEVKAFREYEEQNKPLAVLSDEDRFLYSVSISIRPLPVQCQYQAASCRVSVSFSDFTRR